MADEFEGMSLSNPLWSILLGVPAIILFGFGYFALVGMPSEYAAAYAGACAHETACQRKHCRGDYVFGIEFYDLIREDLSMDENQKQIEDMIKILDRFAASDESRLKISMSEALREGETKRTYHHGRCDIGSPWACGNAFDAQTEK